MFIRRCIILLCKHWSKTIYQCTPESTFRNDEAVINSAKDLNAKDNDHTVRRVRVIDNDINSGDRFVEENERNRQRRREIKEDIASRGCPKQDVYRIV